MLKNIENSLKKAKAKQIQYGLNKLIVTITTNTSKNSQNIYFSPIRIINNKLIFGLVIYTRKQLISLAKLIQKYADIIFIDAEKKIPYSIGDKFFSLYKAEKTKIKKILKKEKKTTLEYVELGNLVSTAKTLIKNKPIFEFKPNDITVDHAWLILSDYFKSLGSKNVALIGSGNIGFKLALKLVESGSTVNLYRRNINLNSYLANSINLIKPKSTLATANAVDDKIKCCIGVDALIGCSNEINIIDEKMIKAMRPNGIILDVGKGNVKNSAVKFAEKKSIKLIRCDISETLSHYINLYSNYKFDKGNYGRKKFNSIYCVSGGYVGKKNDIVVDNFKFPSQILGIADGSGKFKKQKSVKDKKNIKELKKHFK